MEKINLEKVLILIRAVILILLPFCLGALVAPHTQTTIGDSIHAPIQSRYTLTPDKFVYNFTHDQESKLPSKINTIFPFADYLDFWPFIQNKQLQVCFSDNQSYLTDQNNQTIYPQFNWSVRLNNLDIVNVPSGSTECKNIEFDKRFSYRWGAEIGLNISNNETSDYLFTPKTNTYLQWTEDYGVIQGLALIPASYLFIWYPLIGIIKKVKKGIMEQ